MNLTDTIFALITIIFLASAAFSTPAHAQSKQSSGLVMLAGYKVVSEVPTPATGSIVVTLRNDSLLFNGSFDGLSGEFTGAFIHYGTKKENGNKLFNLKPELDKEEKAGTFNPENNRIKLNETQLEALAEGRLYIAIYSTEYQRGEIRGQIPQLKPPE